MRLIRYLLSALVVGTLGVAVTQPTAINTPSPPAIPCSVSSLSAAFTGPLRITDVAQFACVQGWAFMWATVGSGPHAVGVTEVLHFDTPRDAWRVSLRSKVCVPGTMPRYIYLRGCFSN